MVRIQVTTQEPHITGPTLHIAPYLGPRTLEERRLTCTCQLSPAICLYGWGFADTGRQSEGVQDGGRGYLVKAGATTPALQDLPVAYIIWGKQVSVVYYNKSAQLVPVCCVFSNYYLGYIPRRYSSNCQGYDKVCI